ncbi:MAG TPA: 4Fe-4S binding protein [Burkholderiales bacterium]|nr:4Fe-4S binding protein [Burkholderiales bacterium]
MQQLKELRHRNTLKLLNYTPTKILIEDGQPSVISTESNVINGSCIQCNTPSCMMFSPNEVNNNLIENFAADNDLMVCHVEAMSWDNTVELPVIDIDKCIMCGLCAQRCPTGAIFYLDGTLKINYDNENTSTLPFTEENVYKQTNFINKLKETPREGCLIFENNTILKMIYNKIEQIKKNHFIPEKFIRNLMIGLGSNCSSRRVGDVYFRMDAVYSINQDSFGVIEVEFGSDTLSALRNIMDDIAVLHSRYSKCKNENIPIVVCLDLPNMRQGYWQLIKDIHIVENIKVQTISVAALLILLWNHVKFNLKTVEFYADFDSQTIRQAINNTLNRTVNITKNTGFLEPKK